MELCPKYSVRLYIPPQSMMSSISEPINFDGVITEILTKGYSSFSITTGDGRSVGLMIVSFSPLVVVTMKLTPGAVTTRDKENSRSRRSRIMSMCNRPRKPQRKPCPNRGLDSGSYDS